MTEAPALSPQIQDLRDDVCKKAEQRVFDQFPKKVVELSESLKSMIHAMFRTLILKPSTRMTGPLFTIANLSEVQATIDIPAQLTNGITTDEQPGMKRRRTGSAGSDDALQSKPTGSIKQPAVFTAEIPCNKRIEDVINYLKPEIIAAMDSCSEIKLWIQLMIPKIEDGNNFGVSIQEDILSEVTKAESDASTYLDQIARYFTSRGKMVSKLAKYPLLQDYRRALAEYDEKVFLSFRLILTEIRNIYIVLYDVVHKNYEKLKKPRSMNTTSLY